MCSNCGGEGKLKSNCNRCLGTGRDSNGSCAACFGSGGSSSTCNMCKGKGQIPNEGTGGVCWVATAFYGGDSVHPEVVQLREMRETLKRSKIFGWVTELANSVYVRIGHSPFGKYWAKSLIDGPSFTWQRTLSSLFLCAVRIVGRTYRSMFIRNEAQRS